MNEAVNLTDPPKRQVLVVDDDISVCKTYRRSLSLAGYDVHSAFSYKEAISILTEKDLDAVVSDIFLGDMDGLDILEQCHRLDPDIPVILVTGLPTVETASEAVRLKAYEYLPKPVRLEKLTNAVARAVELKSQRLARKRQAIQERNYKRDLENLVAERTKRLIESNQRYQLLFENSKDAIFMASWDGNFLTLNQSALQLFGYKEDELFAVGNTSVLYADPEQHAVFQREILATGFVKDFEVQFKQKNGTPIDCLLTAHLLERSNGKIEGYQGIIRDITAQKEAEKKIRTQNAFLTNVIESLAHPFMVIDARDFKVTIANKAARDSWEDEGWTCHFLNRGSKSPCREKGEACPVEEVVATGRPVHMEHLRPCGNSQGNKHEVHAFPLTDAQGKVKQVILYCIDITEKKRLEAIAEAANLMDNLGYIFSGIRHEIGNPINSIKMALSVLSKNLDRYSIENIREFVDRALNETSRVEYLLKALKNFSLYESLTSESVSIKPFIDNFIALVEKDFSNQGIRIQVDLPDEDCMVLTDHRAFHQVLLNLMINAVDAAREQADPVIGITVTPMPDYVQIDVRDNGCGITVENQRNLFRPFYTSKPDGTGLGLVIVKKMLSKMNSSVRIESVHQQGTTVTMTLPLATDQETHAAS